MAAAAVAARSPGTGRFWRDAEHAVRGSFWKTRHVGRDRGLSFPVSTGGGERSATSWRTRRRKAGLAWGMIPSFFRLCDLRTDHRQSLAQCPPPLPHTPTRPSIFPIVGTESKNRISKKHGKCGCNQPVGCIGESGCTGGHYNDRGPPPSPGETTPNVSQAFADAHIKESNESEDRQMQ